MNLDHIAQQMLEKARVSEPLDPIKHTGMKPWENCAVLLVDDYPVRLQLTRTKVSPTKDILQLSIGSPSGNVNSIPDVTYQKIRKAYFPNESMELPSVLGNCRQFACL